MKKFEYWTLGYICYNFFSTDQNWENIFFNGKHWADDKQSKAQNSDSKYRQMALVGFDT